MTIFVFGLGYSARAAVAALRAQNPGARFAGTTRGRENFPDFQRLGVTPHVFTGAAPGETLAGDLDAATHLLVSIAPSPDGDPVLAHHRDAVLAAPKLEWLCYFSTIGVYGDAGGAWIDESHLGNDLSERARKRLVAEVGWQRLARQKNVPLLILRLAGIYGPGRSVFDKLREGRAQRVVKPGQVFNRIHAEDIGRVVALAAAQKLAGIYNLADDLPAAPQEVMAHAADRAGLPLPPEIPFESADLSPMARDFYADNKRVSNQAIKQALGIELAYPTFREGLAAILDAERGGP